MSKVSPIEALRSVRTWKKFGSPNCYGRSIFGFSFYGEENDFAGIYRRRPHPGGVSIVKMQFYRPPVSRTDGQATQRDKFQAAVSAWQALTDEERQAKRTEATRRSKRGYNVFLTEYLETH
jgi:hypothetical protein